VPASADVLIHSVPASADDSFSSTFNELNLPFMPEVPASADDSFTTALCGPYSTTIPEILVSANDSFSSILSQSNPYPVPAAQTVTVLTDSVPASADAINSICAINSSHIGPNLYPIHPFTIHYDPYLLCSNEDKKFLELISPNFGPAARDLINPLT
jgi:hypothetical protein